MTSMALDYVRCAGRNHLAPLFLSSKLTSKSCAWNPLATILTVPSFRAAPNTFGWDKMRSTPSKSLKKAIATLMKADNRTSLGPFLRSIPLAPTVGNSPWLCWSLRRSIHLCRLRRARHWCTWPSSQRQWWLERYPCRPQRGSECIRARSRVRAASISRRTCPQGHAL